MLEVSALINREEQRHLLQPSFNWSCHECGSDLKDLGYWHGADGRHVPRYRCVAAHCTQSVRIQVDPRATSWVACGYV